MNFQKINKVENVLGFEPKNGSYSFTKDNLNYLCIKNNLMQKEECPLELSLRGEYMYVWYGSLEKVEIYYNGDTLISSVEGNVFLLNEKTLYIGYSLLELTPFQTYENLKNPFTNKLILKVRQKQKGTNQYEKLANKGEYFYVNEYGAKLWVNLTDYLDTGLFLDHRLTRKMLGEMAQGKDFLNLFAYTGSATVHAALGKAKSTTTVDMSNTYLNWAEQNLLLNDIEGKQHKLIQADCLQWLEKCDRQFDLIFVDPPTFSNSKRMEDSWDVQRDHIKLMTNLKRILRPNGTIVFSNNKRGFKMDFAKLEELGLSAVEISHKTLPLDFERNKQIHNCWLVTLK